MDGPFVPAEGAAGWKASTNPVLALAPLAASLAIFDEVGMPALRARSVALTGYLEALLEPLLTRLGSTVDHARATPRRVAPSCRCASGPRPRPKRCWPAFARGVVADFRAPDIIRFAPMPLYNRYDELARLVAILAEGGSTD